MDDLARREISRLAEEVRHARTSLDTLADCMRDEASALNANLRVLDRDNMERARLHNDIAKRLDAIEKRLGEIDGRVHDLDHSIGIDQALADLPGELADKIAPREQTGPVALVPLQREQSPVGLTVGRFRVPITWDGASKAAWIVAKIGVLGSAAWAWAKLALAKWGHGGW